MCVLTAEQSTVLTENEVVAFYEILDGNPQTGKEVRNN